MLSLIFGVLLIVLIVWLVTGMTRTRKNPLDDIAKLAAIEATAPQGSEARKLLTEELARPAREAKKRQGLWIVIVAFFAVTYIFVPASDTSKQTSAPAPVKHASSEAITAKPAAPAVPQRHLFTVIKSFPSCTTANDYVQLIYGTDNGHCERWTEVGQKVWLEDVAERTIDGSRTHTIKGSPTIKIVCVSPPYKSICYWTGASVIE